MARNYLIGERPDAILNIIDGTNLERNLYLTTQLTELGIPVVVAVNMMDVVKKNGDKINTERAVPGAGLPGGGDLRPEGHRRHGGGRGGRGGRRARQDHVPMHTFSGAVEHALAHIEEAAATRSCPRSSSAGTPSRSLSGTSKVLEQLKLSQAGPGSH